MNKLLIYNVNLNLHLKQTKNSNFVFVNYCKKNTNIEITN